MRGKTWTAGGALAGAACLLAGCEIVAGLGGETPYPPDAGTSSGGTGGTGMSAAGSGGASGGSAVSCSNALKDGDESDKDCGGSCPTPCGDGMGCITGEDCASQSCTSGTCVAASCADGVKNGPETDVDCGGPACPKCADDKACSVLADCQSGMCANGLCLGSFIWQRRYAADLFRALAADESGNAILAGSYSGTVDFGGGGLTSGTSGADCFVVKLDPGGNHLWSKPFHGTSQRVINDIATYDSSYPGTAGYIAVAGDFQGTIDFAGKSFLSAGSSDGFAVLLDTAGVIQSTSSNKYGDAAAQGTTAIGYRDGYAAVAGKFAGTIDFGSKQYTNQTTFTSQSALGDLYIGELTVGIKLLWGKSFTGPYNMNVMRVAVDDADSVVFAASFRGYVDFGGGQLATAADDDDVFVAKFDKSGNHVWSYRLGGDDNQEVKSLAVDASGNVFLAGWFAGSLKVGVETLTNAAGDMFVVKLDPDGNPLWSKRAPKSGATGVAVDSAGSVVVTGNFTGDVDFGGGLLINAGQEDVFVVKYDAAGNHVWSRGFGDSQAQYAGGGYAGGVAVVDTSTILLGGTFAGILDFGGGPMVSMTGSDVYVAKLRTP